MIPTWLRRQLETAGRWNVDGIHRRLSGGRCPRCKQLVLRALDDDVAGLPVTCDPQPIDELGEALALLQGRTTYAIAHRSGRWQIDPRDRYRIAARRPDTVLAQHQCHGPPLPAAGALTDLAPHRPSSSQEPPW